MNKLSARERFLLAIFALTLVWGIWNLAGHWSGTGTDRPAAAVRAPSGAHAPAATLETPRPAPPPWHAPAWGSDPFRRPWRRLPAPAGAAVRGTALRLSAVVVRDDGRYAVINGRIVREGETIEGRRVLKVERTFVLVDEQGVKVTLSL